MLFRSKIREPVYGCKSPSRSASSITSRANGQWEAVRCRYHIKHTSERDTVLYAAPRVEVLQKRWLSEAIESPHVHISATVAHLRLAKDLDTQCIAERVDPNQRSVSCMIQYALPQLSPRTRASTDDGHAPINPDTPSCISSLRNSMGRESTLATALSSIRFLYAEMADVVAKERENPMRMP